MTVNAQILGRYRIQARLGRGGMGEVFQAYDPSLSRPVALKILPAEFARDPDRLRRFEREAKAVAALNHPNIVTLYSVEEADGVHFLTMELVEGRSLVRKIARGGMPLDRFFEIAVPLADALAAAHEKGIVHRDLKPGNVMVTSEGRLKVLDFGLAKLTRPELEDQNVTAAPTVSLETGAGVVLGTMGYMSPEQVRGEAVDRRTDIFALGLVLYELATGCRAFDANTSPDVMSAILRDSPRPVDELRPELPRHLGRVIRRCLEKDPERRYQTAIDVRNELADLEKELETEAILQSRPVSAAGERPRRRGHGAAIAAAVALLIVAVTVAYWLVASGVEGPPAAGRTQIRSLAVLPFDNLMNDPEQEYFVEGMHEALITDLAKMGALRVISRTSAMRYRETEKSIPEIARELDVDALIEGSVLRADGQVRVTAQLIDGRTDEHLWADSYDRELENTLALLSEVAQAIASEIEVKVTAEQSRRLGSARAVDPEVQELYLRGRYYFNRGSIEGFRQALPFFREAVELDPEFAAGWAALGGAYLVHGFFNMAPPDEVIPAARDAANRALELDDSQGPAHGVLGSIALLFDWNWTEAKRHLELALELDSTSVLTHHAYADYLGVMRDCEGSVQQVLRGRRQDPMGVWANLFVVGHLGYCGRYEEAVEEGRRARDLGLQNPSIRDFVGFALWQLARYDEALSEWREAFGPDDPAVQTLERGYAEGGPRGAMLARAEALAAAAKSRPVNPFSVATYYAAAGQANDAFEWLERAFERRTPQLLHLVFHPQLDPIRADPRFAELLRRIGIPEEG